MLSLPRTTLLALVATLVATQAPALANAAGNLYTNKALGPAAGAGRYLPGQDSPSLFHGCRKQDRQWYPTSLIDGSQVIQPNTDRYVTFTISTDSSPTFSWTAKPGYAICGVVVFADLANENSGGGGLLAYATYTSGRETGSTAASGKETITVRTPKNLADGQPSLKNFAGQKLGIYGFQNVTVYVKKG